MKGEGCDVYLNSGDQGGKDNGKFHSQQLTFANGFDISKAAASPFEIPTKKPRALIHFSAKLAGRCCPGDKRHRRFEIQTA